MSLTRARTLEAKVAATCVAISDGRLGNLRVDSTPTIADELVFRLSAYVYGERFEGPEFRVPLDWKEGVKERFFPAWAKARWPVRYRVFKAHVFVGYPEHVVPELGPTCRVWQMGELPNYWAAP